MAEYLWLETLRDRLTRHDLPPTYIRRVLEEIEDHIEDLKEEDLNMATNLDVRLGQPEVLADASAHEYRRSRGLKKRPLAAFGIFVLSPLPVTILIEAAALAAIIGGVSGLEWLGADGRVWARAVGGFLPHILIALTILLPAILVSTVYVGLARRWDAGRGWMLVACLVPALIAAISTCQVTLSEVPGQSNLSFGFGFGFGWQMMIKQLSQMIVPLLFACWLARRISRRTDHRPAVG